MIIVHIPSWYPNSNNSMQGSFIKNHIVAISSHDRNKHIVLNWHDTKSYSLKKPFTFFKEFVKSYFKYNIETEGNIDYVKFKYFNSYYSIFGSNEKRLIKRITNVVESLHAKNKIDIIHAHVSYPAGYIAQFIKAKLNIPYIISEHMGPFPFESFIPKIEELIISPIKNADKVVAVSTALSKDIESITGKKASVIPNVINGNDFKIDFNNFKNEEFKFITVAGLSYIKGIDILIKSVAHIAEKKKEFKLIVIGDGPIMYELKDLALELKVEKFIVWMGKQNSKVISEKLQESDCFVSSSRHESFGVSLVEALACGKPLIATKSGGPNDIVNEDNGILVESENETALAKAMIWMIENVKKFDSVLIRKNFESKYTASVVANKYILIYNELYKNETDD